MKISGFSFVRNGIKFDYPFLESIQSILHFCDEYVIAVGNSDDGTLEAIQSIRSNKIKIIETVWDETLRSGGAILAQQTNIALDNVTGDWAFYLQADEVVHENDLPIVRRAMEDFLDRRDVEGLLFSYNHFYGNYDFVGDSRRWYRHEIRVVRTGTGVKSRGDAQGFRIGERKLRVKLIPASIYHYGWVKSPEKQQAKQRSFHRLWHPDEWVTKNVGESTTYDYGEGGRLVRFVGSHPSVMRDRIGRQNWSFEYDAASAKVPLKEKMLDWIEEKTGRRFGEYRNYELI